MKPFIKPLFNIEGLFSVSNNGYRINRIIMFSWAFVVVLVVGLAFRWYLLNGTVYISCPSSATGLCENPLFNECSRFPLVCDKPFFVPGESYGVKPPYIYEDIVFLFFFSLVLVLIFNHQLYNRGVIKWNV
jgi:hypothetical protein